MTDVLQSRIKVSDWGTPLECEHYGFPCPYVAYDTRLMRKLCCLRNKGGG